MYEKVIEDMYMTLSSAVELCVMYALQIRGHYEIQNIFY